MNEYYDDYRRIEFSAEVLETYKEDDKYWIVSETSCFFVEGGGMAKDEGTLNDLPVFDVKFQDGKYHHLVAEQLTGTIKGVVDYDQRLAKVQIHSAQHLISALVESSYRLTTVSHHVAAEGNDIEFNGAEHEVDVIDLQNRLNACLLADYPLVIEYPMPAEARLHAKTESLDHEELRVVRIGELDYNLCACIHVRHLGEIGLIFVKEWTPTKNGGVIRYLAGQQLLDYLRPRYQILNQATKALALDHLQIAKGIERLQQDNRDLHYQLQGYKQERLEKLAMELRESEAALICEFDDLEVKEGQYLVSWLQQRQFAFNVGLVLKLTDESCHILVSAPEAQVIFRELSEVFELKGGGNSRLAQGGGTYNGKIISWLERKLN